MSDRVLGVIPARGGSTRIPDKNLKQIDGMPMIAHTIRDAESANMIDDAIVSTENERIATVAKEYNGNVPFKRPDELATDKAPTNEVITHAIEWATEEYSNVDYVSLLQVTSPLREPEDIDNALHRLQETSSQSVVSVSEYLSPPQWAVAENNDGYLESQSDSAGLWQDEYVRSQDLGTLLHPNGAVSAATIDAWTEFESFYTPETVGYEMPAKRSLDIDEPWELELVRKMIHT